MEREVSTDSKLGAEPDFPRVPRTLPSGAVGRARRMPRVSHFALEARLVEAAAIGLALLVPISILLPVWLALDSPSDRGGPYTGLLDACQRELERGPLGVPGYIAAGLLFGWGALATTRLLCVGRRVARRQRQLQRALGRVAVRSELSFRGRPLSFRLLPDVTPIAFTAGLLRPSIYLSRGLFFSLGREEQEAVLAHELAHVQRRDPLRCLGVQLGAGALGERVSRVWAPRYRALRELSADHCAIGEAGDPRPLIRALERVSPWVPEDACGMTQGELAGLVVLRAADRGVARRDVTAAVVAVLGLLALALVALIGLTDWQSFAFCPLAGPGP